MENMAEEVKEGRTWWNGYGSDYIERNLRGNPTGN